MKENDTILITGGYGLLGMNLAEHLKKQGYNNIVQLSSKECDLRKLENTLDVFAKYKPNYVFHCAAFVKGIMGNIKNQAESFLANTLINTNTIHACYKVGVKKIIAIGTGAIYPEGLQMPLQEKDIWHGVPHYTELGYGHAKRHMLAQAYAYNDSYGLEYSYVMSPNLYGPYDRFDIEQGHVIPSLIKKFYDASCSDGIVNVWGNGSAKRDFLYVEDAAKALTLIANKVNGAVNMGSGEVYCIRDVVNYLNQITCNKLTIKWDETKPNGQDARFYDLSILESHNFKPQHSLLEGLMKTYKWYEQNHETARKN